MKKNSHRRLTLLLLQGVVLSTVLASTATGAVSTAWSWRAAGTLGRNEVCSKVGQRLAVEVCGFHVPNAPRTTGTVTGVVRVRNDSRHTECYGVSLTTSYMAGLQSFCAKAKSTGQFKTSGPARHYVGTQLTIFVTSGSKTKPIQPTRSLDTSPFTIVFSESLPS